MIYKYEDSLPFILILLAGIVLILISVLQIKGEKRKNILSQYIKKEKLSDNFLDNILNKSEKIAAFEEKNEKKLSIISDKITARGFTKITLYSVGFGLLFSLIIRNVIAIPIIIGICYYLPEVYLDMIIKNKRMKIEEQLGIAIKFFTTEYTTNRSVVVAIQNILPKLPYPIKKEFEILVRELNSGETPKACFENFSKRLDNKFAYVFSRLLISYFHDGTDFAGHLVRLSEDITDEQIQHKESRTELAMVRSTNVILNAVVILSIVVMFLVFPSRSLYFKSTAQGQMLMTGVIINSFISLILGIRLERK